MYDDIYCGTLGTSFVSLMPRVKIIKIRKIVMIIAVIYTMHQSIIKVAGSITFRREYTY